MGIFNFKKENELTDEERFNAVLKQLESEFVTTNKNKYQDYLNFEEKITLDNVGSNNINAFIFIMKFIANTPWNFNDSITKVLNIINNMDDEEIYKPVLMLIERHPEYYDKILSALSVFQNKSLVSGYLSKYIFEFNPDKLNVIFDYILKSRQYFIDEASFLSSIINFENSINNPLQNKDDYERILNEKIKEDKELAGIYPTLDEKKLEKYLEKMETVSKDFALLEESYKRIIENKDSLMASKDEISSLIDSKLTSLEQTISKYDSVIENGRNILKEVSSEQLNKIRELLLEHSLLEHSAKKVSKIEIEEGTISAFDESIPIKNRYEKIMSLKQNSLYHECFDKVVKDLLLKKSVYLVGASGNGKSYLIYQIAKMLGLKIYNIGFVVDEYTSFKGYNDANGIYVPTPFYYAFKYGGLLFVDEIDNSESKALVEMNKFVENFGYKEYLFPNGELVKPHPNFRLIAAGNTWGEGADEAYSSREKLDYATIRRFDRIEFTIDKKLEKNLYNLDKELYEFIEAYRRVLETKNEELFSLADTEDVYRFVESGLYTEEDIIDKKFVKHNRKEYLEAMSYSLSEICPNNKYLKLYNSNIRRNK